MEETYIMLVLTGQRAVSQLPEPFREKVKSTICQRYKEGGITEETYRKIAW